MPGMAAAAEIQTKEAGKRNVSDVHDWKYTGFFLAFLVRLVLVVFGEWQDRNFVVKYTDVDYHVYTDAARHVWTYNGSPFDRHTYRYSPLIAWTMIPNIAIHPVCGKLLFCLSDMAVGLLIYSLCRSRGLNSKSSLAYSSFWLFNPIAVNVSTRGNADTFACCLVLLIVYFMTVRKSADLSAIVLGVAIHMRIFPVVFAPTLLFFIGPDYCPSVRQSMLKLWRLRARYVAISVFSFTVLGALCYALYGWTFVHQAYLYHVTRVDTRHNFSPFFYGLYLEAGSINSDSCASTPEECMNEHAILGVLAMLPQIAVQGVLAWRLKGDPSFAICLQTIAFVTFNKVCTAQYFLWYIAVLPVALPSTSLTLWPLGLALTVCWWTTELNWLAWGFQLEFKGSNVFSQVWEASLLFFGANVALMFALLHSYIGSGRVFAEGKLKSYMWCVDMEKKIR